MILASYRKLPWLGESGFFRVMQVALLKCSFSEKGRTGNLVVKSSTTGGLAGSVVRISVFCMPGFNWLVSMMMGFAGVVPAVSSVCVFPCFPPQAHKAIPMHKIAVLVPTFMCFIIRVFIVSGRANVGKTKTYNKIRS